MAAMIYELDATGKIDKAFLDKYTYGWAELRRYIVGEEDGVKKTPEWAEKISGVPASKIRSFAHEVQEHRTMFMIGWGIQRIDFGEQSHWMLAALCSVLGQIGLRAEDSAPTITIRPAVLRSAKRRSWLRFRAA